MTVGGPAVAPDAPRSLGRRVVRALVFVAAAAVSSAAVLVLTLRLLATASKERGTLSFDLLRQVAEARGELRKAGRGADRILLVGDSMLGQGEGLPTRLAVPFALREAGGGAANGRVVPLWRLGFSVAAQYFMVDDLVALGADRVVLEVNLRLLGASCPGCWHHPELAGHVRPSRYPEALLLPLDVAGVTANRLLFSRLVLALGLEPAWAALTDVQARLFNLKEGVEKAFESWVGIETMSHRKVGAYFTVLAHQNMPGKAREPLEHVLARPWAMQAGVDETYPPFALLGAVVRRFADATQRPLVWIAPVNVDHLRSLGLDVSGFVTSAKAMRAVVERNGGTLLDLHDALRDAEFADSFDHPTTQGEHAGSLVIARRIAAALVAEGQAPDRRAVQ